MLSGVKWNDGKEKSAMQVYDIVLEPVLKPVLKRRLLREMVARLERVNPLSEDVYHMPFALHFAFRQE